MTSAINYSAINTAYPVAGQDNNSQGFRDNFTAISVGLSTAKTEISALQQNAVLVQDLATSSIPVVNNMLGSTLSNGLISQINPVFYNLGNVTSAGSLININNGPVQQVRLTGSATLTFSNWGPAGSFSSIKLIIFSDQSTSRTATLATTNSGIMRTATGWVGGTGPITVVLGTNNLFEVIEAWTTNGGANVYLKNIGQYSGI
jgi:hypothetical protein